jgi:branched-chain amino acid transport system permease protein
VLRGFGDFRLVLYGVALTLAVLFMPGGMMQAAQVFRAQLGFFRSKLDAEGTQ